MLPRIVILATGGTIAGHALDVSHSMEYASGVMGVDELLAAVPALAAIASIHCEQVANIGSEDMTEQVWLALTEAARRYCADESVAGVVVLHGTDTLEETAYFLSLALRSHKPLVMTGAMRPANATSADGPANIFNAVKLAAAPESAGKSVLVCLNEKIAAARDVTKTNTTDPGTFKTPVTGELGFLVDGNPFYYREPVRLGGVNSEFSVEGLSALPRVEIIYGHAGQRPDLVHAAVAAGARGIVHAGVGMGQVHAEVVPALQKAVHGGVPVVCSSRVGSGIVLTGGKQSRNGFITADNLNPQKARVLLQLALTKTTDTAEIQRMFNTY